MAEYNYQDFAATQSVATGVGGTPYKKSPQWFSLNPGESALVRFLIHRPEDIKVLTVHTVNIWGKDKEGNDKLFQKKVNCVGSKEAPWEACPLCTKYPAKEKPANFKDDHRQQARIFVKLIKYVEENGQIVAVPMIWDRPYSFEAELKAKLNKLGDLSNGYVLSVTRIGSGKDTKYDISPAVPEAVYNTTTYPVDFSAFDNYNLIGDAILNEDVNALKEIANGTYHIKSTFVPKQQPQQQTYQAPYQTAYQAPYQNVQPQPQQELRYVNADQPWTNAATDAGQTFEQQQFGRPTRTY